MPANDIDRLRRWSRDGFFVAPRFLRPERMRELAEACDHVLAQVRAASHDQGHSSTHVAGLLAPEYFVDHPDLLTRLADAMSSREVTALLDGLARVGEGLPNLRDTQYFHEPTGRDDDGHWHRDGAGPAGSAGAPAGERPTLVRLRMAFAPDDHLEYVPGSHARPDTTEEHSAIEKRLRDEALSHEAVRIELEPGDVCVFDTWGIHRARYRRDRVRRTLDLLFGFGPRRRIGFDDAVKALMARG
jgi:ectoine hydroxylase-related dioxygenase (phytanoyl-CoA dioxygenase family)